MATVSEKSVGDTSCNRENVPQWKKDLIARLRTQKDKSEDFHDEERLWSTHHAPHPRTDLVCPMSPENGFHKDSDTPNSSDSEDLHYGPGIVNRLRNKYLSLALRESNNRPTILRKATSLENLLDEEDRISEPGKTDGVLFLRRKGVNENGNRYRSSNRQQQMKRARSVEVISRASHDNELSSMTSSVTEKINNRQSLHEDLLLAVNDDDDEKTVPKEISKPYKKPLTIENGSEDNEKPAKALNRPKKIPPLLREREKPPVDVVKHAKMIFEKRPETRTKKPQTTGDVAAKVDSFNDIIVKTKVGLKPTKPAIKISKPVLVDKKKSNTQSQLKPVAKPVIINEEPMVKPKTLELVTSPKQEKMMPFQSLPSPIPDVSRVETHHDGEIRNNFKNSLLCETPDLILTSSPIPKLISPTYSKRSTENFLKEERNRSIEGGHKYPNTPHSPSKPHPKPNTLNFNREHEDSLGIKMISPISQNNITKHSASSVFNFTQAQVDQRHLPGGKKAVPGSPRIQSPIQKSPRIQSPVFVPERKCPEKVCETNGFVGSKVKLEVSAFEMVRNLRNHAKSVEVIKAEVACVESEELPVRKSPVEVEVKKFAREPSADKPFERVVLKSVQSSKKSLVDASVVDCPEEKPAKVSLPKAKSRKEENTVAVFNFTTRKDVPDYIANDTSRVPSKPTIPKPDEPGIKIIPESFIANFQEVWEEDELIRSLEARPPSPCDVTFINDNILIDGKSCFVQQTSRRIKLKISFIDDADVFEYPSESSLLVDDHHSSPLATTAPPIGHTTPTLTASAKLQKEGFQLVLEKDGSKIDEDEILVLLKNEVFLLLEKDEIWRDINGDTLSCASTVSVNSNLSNFSFASNSNNNLSSDTPVLIIQNLDESIDVQDMLIDKTASGPEELLIENTPASPLACSSLASYTPKTTEEFQLGVSKSFHEPMAPAKPPKEEPISDDLLEEVDQPVLFSSGRTSDILF